jgi:DNA-binding CsgD family transcriptional regulator
VDAAATAVGDEIREAIKRLVAEGMTDSQIGRRVGLKPRAVQNRIRQIKQELGVESRSELCFLLGRQFDDGWNARVHGHPTGPAW